MKISIFGLGYVGTVSAACFAKIGHKVIGVDINEKKVELLRSGKSPIVEKDLDKYINEGINNGALKATKDATQAVSNTELSLICVGTPSQINGNIDLSYVYRVIEEIALEIKEKETFHTVVVRSTVIPGTINNCVEIIEEISGKTHGQGFGVVSNPEFLREGTAIEDFWNPPYTVIGTDIEKCEEKLKVLYKEIEAPFHSLKPKEAEMIKYANNNFHAVKISFANEIGNICKELGIDGTKVMDLVSKDKKLNLSSYYMKPGFAFGGSCLPKDVRGLNYFAKSQDLQVPLLGHIMESNEYQIERALNLIYKTEKKSVGFLGFAFKEGTDDLRESPVVTLIETLLGKGFDVSIFDKNVLLSKMTGKNKDYLLTHIPHIAKILESSAEDVAKQSDVVVIGNKSEKFEFLFSDDYSETTVIDLVKIKEEVSKENYVGICW